MQVDEVMTDDERWLKDAPKMRDGWTAGRVFCGKDGGDGAFGWTRGHFGVYEVDARVDNMPGTLATVGVLTHILTGFIVSIFNDAETAALAAEFAETTIEWSTITAENADAREPDFLKVLHMWADNHFFALPIVVLERPVLAFRKLGGRDH